MCLSAKLYLSYICEVEVFSPKVEDNEDYKSCDFED